MRMVAEIRVPLIGDTAPEERGYELGKIQNVRVAAAKLNGTRVPANATFSFWRQLGRCTRRRGFVVGRQIQEGCLIPSVGGGLCLLSNALYAAARRAGLEIVERHPHTRVLPGSLSEIGQDATVAWNHVDLRFRHDRDWRLVVELTAQELIVRIQAISGTVPLPMVSGGRTAPRLDPADHACGRCAETACVRFIASPTLVERTVTVALDLEPEFRDGPTWTLADPGPGLRLASLHARLAARRALGRDGTSASVELARAEVWARAVARALPPEATRLRIDLRLLPRLWESGALGGREFEVLAMRPSLGDLQNVLDLAAERHPDRRLLRDFRAPEALVRAETAALARADRILTPHRAAFEAYGERAVLLDWRRPEPIAASKGRTIVFPGPTHARKGAHEVRAAALAQGLPVRTLRGEFEGNEFWSGVEQTRETERTRWFAEALVVVQPAVVEERPRTLLLALASGVPVIATEACGLVPQPGLTLVPPGDAKALLAAIEMIRR